MANKGGPFEREICHALSSWWSGGTRDDIFWRSSGSGGRATMRGRKGKSTFGSYGDVAAVDPIGRPLLELCTIEMKRGYSRLSAMDLIDAGAQKKKNGFEEFVQQAVTEHEAAGSVGWLLIHRRDKRRAVAYLPSHVFKALCDAGADLGASGFAKMSVLLRISGRLVRVRFAAVLLDDLFTEVTPQHVQAALVTCKEQV